MALHSVPFTNVRTDRALSCRNDARNDGEDVINFRKYYTIICCSLSLSTGFVIRLLDTNTLFVCFSQEHSLGTMACGRVENCSDQPSLAPVFLPQIEHLSELDQFLDYNSNKKRFLWNGNADDLGKFIEDRILSYDEDEDDAPELVISSNSQCAVFKTSLATFDFYYSTKTLHVQGKACSEMRNRLLDVFNLRTNSFQKRQENGGEPCASLNRQNSGDKICVLTDLNNNQGVTNRYFRYSINIDKHRLFSILIK